MSDSAPKSLLLVFTGDGKGKTTAALGVAFRAAGRGMSTRIIQFIKRPGSSGEQDSAKMLGPLVSIEARGTGFIHQADEAATERAREAARNGWEDARRLLRDGGPDIVVLDELTVALNHGLLDLAEVVEALSRRRPGCHVIVTGRGAPQELCDVAALVTEMVPRKHPHEQGCPAEPGLDF